jgi:glycosyltransferase involved in cell wall biosynthesis/peptidoglycan/xylan/chitin deacetylase (PgdA/CDA1 family)
MSPLNTALKFLSRDKLSVFLFHKVPAIADPIFPTDLSLASFEQTIDFVAERFKVLPLDEAVAAIQRGKLPSNAACITFDDGYPGWLTGAAAALERRNLHATFFITSGQFKGVPMWHERVACAVKAAPGPVLVLPGFGLPTLPLRNMQDRCVAVQRLESFLKYQRLDVREGLLARLEAVAAVRVQDVACMAVDDLRALHSKGFGIGAHTVLHPILSLCDAAQAEHEIGAVREELELLVGGAVRSFAYPNGRPVTDFTADHVRMVQKAGYQYAVTTQWGWASNTTPVFQIPRFTPWGPDNLHMALQVARNLMTKPRLFSVASQTSMPLKPVKVLFVENGAGFGGAVIALQTLLAHVPADSAVCDVVSNMPVGNFVGLPAVRSHQVITDHVYDFRMLAKKVQDKRFGLMGRALLFGIGRMDDLVNRLPYLLRLTAHVVRVNPDIVHGNNEPNSNREAMLVAKLLRKPYVQHVRGALGHSRHTPWLLSKPDMFVPVSRWLASDLINAGVGAGRVRHIYDAVDLSALRNNPDSGSLRHELGIGASTVLVAMVGMLVPWKGQRLFLDAVKLMAVVNEKVVFLLIGGTPERASDAFEAELRSKVVELGLEGRLFFLGRRNDIPSLLPEIEVVVSTSLEPEPLGLVMLEAMASGCIFVAPAHGAATEVVVDGENGFLFTPSSAVSLANKLAEAIEQADHRSALVDQARLAVQTQFSGDKCATATVALHQTIQQGRL